MGEAREVADRLTEAMLGKDLQGMRDAYAADAVAETPDAGTIRGGEAIVAWLAGFFEGFPDAGYEAIAKHECDDVAIDEGFLVGTHTGPLSMPDGERIEPTGNAVRIRSCDVMEVRDGVVASHRFYYDQMELLSQLGLAAPAQTA